MDAPEKFPLTNIRSYVRCTRAEGVELMTAKLDTLITIWQDMNEAKYTQEMVELSRGNFPRDLPMSD